MILAVVVALCALPASAFAGWGSGPRERIKQTFSTKAPGKPTGAAWTGHYHAAGNPKGDPPFLNKMTFYPPKGFRYDTNVPDKCTADDAQLSFAGLDACPPDSWLGGGTTWGIFYEPIGNAFVIDRFRHHIDIVNNTGEQIILVRSEGTTVVRGKFQPDGGLEFKTPTCFPNPPTGECASDYIRQLGSTNVLRPFTRRVNGQLKSYATTPAKCPRSGYWRSSVSFWWADGSKDNVATKQPCRRPPASRTSY